MTELPPCPHISIPPDAVQTEGYYHYWYFVGDPTIIAPIISFLGMPTAIPPVSVYLGCTCAYQNADGTDWKPGVEALSESGRMIRAVLWDAQPLSKDRFEGILRLLEPLPLTAQGKILLN